MKKCSLLKLICMFFLSFFLSWTLQLLCGKKLIKNYIFSVVHRLSRMQRCMRKAIVVIIVDGLSGKNDLINTVGVHQNLYGDHYFYIHVGCFAEWKLSEKQDISICPISTVSQWNDFVETKVLQGFCLQVTRLLDFLFQLRMTCLTITYNLKETIVFYCLFIALQSRSLLSELLRLHFNTITTALPANNIKTCVNVTCLIF